MEQDNRSQRNIQWIVDELLNMQPDPIPYFILLKEFKKLSPKDRAYQNAYDKVIEHPFVKDIEREQTELGYWREFHGYTETIIRRCLSIGLERHHPSFDKVCSFIETVLEGKDIWHQRCEKQDNPRWWLDMFMPLVSVATLSLIEPEHPLLTSYIALWKSFAESAFEGGHYDPRKEIESQYAHFHVKTKRVIPFYNYYAILLLTSQKNTLASEIDRSILDFCMHKEDGIYYIYDKKPSLCIPMQDTKYFYPWLRCLSILSRFGSWDEYKNSYYDWIWSQRNSEGLWDLIKKPRSFGFPLSNTWRKEKNRIIDSTIFVLRFLSNDQGF